MRPSEKAVRTATGRDWAQWFAALDAVGAAEWDHKAIVQHLETAHPELESGWWRQSLTVEYEKERGLRVLGQTADTGFQVGVRRTLGRPPEQLWELLVQRPELWLGEGDVTFAKGESYDVGGLSAASGTVRVVVPPKRVRLTWQPHGWTTPATLQLTLTPVGGERTALVVHLEKLPDADAREVARVHWSDVLERLATGAAR